MITWRLSVLLGSTGLITVLLSTYQWSLHRTHPTLIKDIQRVFHPCGVVLGVLEIILAIDVTGSIGIYPYWIVLILRDLIMFTLYICASSWAIFVMNILLALLDDGRLATKLRILFKLSCFIFVPVTLITDILAISMNSPRFRAIWTIYLTISGYISALINIITIIKVKQAHKDARQEMPRSQRWALMKFKLSAATCISGATFLLRRTYTSLTTTESLEQNQGFSEDISFHYLVWMAYTVSNVFIVYTSWISTA